jgi:hypothetical protein
MVTPRGSISIGRESLKFFWLSFGEFQDTECFLIPCPCHVSSRLPPSSETCKYATAPSTQKKIWGFSTYWYAPLQCDHPGYYTAEVGNPKGTYELPCIYFNVISALQNAVWLLCHIFWSVSMLIVTSRLSVAEKGRAPKYDCGGKCYLVHQRLECLSTCSTGVLFEPHSSCTGIVLYLDLCQKWWIFMKCFVYCHLFLCRH